MRNVEIKLLNVLLFMLAVGCKEEVRLPPLAVPKIVIPQADAVCQGEKQENGSYKIQVESSMHIGVSEYVFELWNNSGSLVNKIITKESKVFFSNLEGGKSYAVGVRISNTNDSKESIKISFSTPGAKIANYIPVIKKAKYLKAEGVLYLAFHDADSLDLDLFYSIQTSETTEFSKKDIIKEKEVVKNNQEIVISGLSFKDGTYLKIIVEDKSQNRSTYILFVS